MSKSGQRVRLIHELAELGGSEELLDGSNNRTDVDQALRSDRLRILRRHALTHNPLETGQTNPDLILNQLADGTNATVAEVIDVVGAHRDLGATRQGDPLVPGVQCNQVANRIDDVVVAE